MRPPLFDCGLDRVRQVDGDCVSAEAPLKEVTDRMSQRFDDRKQWVGRQVPGGMVADNVQHWRESATGIVQIG